MEKILAEEIKTVSKLCISSFTKNYMEKMAFVEIVKCIVNAETGELLKKDSFQNRVFRNDQSTNTNEFDMLLSNIAEMGEEAYFEKLLGIIVTETSK